MLDVYGGWPTPKMIVSDGAYGVGGFPGDPRTVDGLVDWYRPHIESWDKHAHPSTTLWFWNTEQGWATVHPLLVEHGWQFEQVIVWDKGMAHIAGNVNGKTLRRFPVVTEVCVLYSRKLTLPTEDGMLPAQEWLRHEWQRTGLPLYKANEACGVRNAATRKYLTADWLWYFPPGEMVERMGQYANRYGEPTDRLYFSLDGVTPVRAGEWSELRYEWNFEHGLTNVWSHPPVNGNERFRGNGKRVAPRKYNPGSNAAAHLNQKPLEFMRRMIEAASSESDVVWEPFGGLCTASVVAVEKGRSPYAAEVVSDFADIAEMRLDEAVENR
ncbi:MAG: site-specific DNA-methyltransferase [Acidimicrobiia bacterium]|nr:site-specific DNA-methyltransferase [Acidimicrobiia bacterium]